MLLSELFERASDNANMSSQSEALGDLCMLFRSTRDRRAMRVFCAVALDSAADLENRWLAYVFALEVADFPYEQMPKKTNYNGFRVPEDFDVDLLSLLE